MLKLKLGPRAPEGAIVLAHTAGPNLTVSENLILDDRSFELEENLTGMHKRTQIAQLVADQLTDTDVTLFRRTVLDRYQKFSIPLPYVWNIGTNTALGRNRYYVHDDAAAALGVPASIESQRKVEETIKKNLTVVNQFGDEVPSYHFMVEYITRITVGSVVMFDLNIYVDRKSSDSTQYRLRYNAVDSVSNSVIYNYTESINGTVDIVYETLDVGESSTLGIDFFLRLGSDNSIHLDTTGLGEPGVQALGLFADKTGITYTIIGTNLTLIDGVATLVVSLTSKSVRDVANEINASNFPCEASVMADGLDATVLQPAAMPLVVPEESGIAIRLDSHFGVVYHNRTRIFTKRPPEHFGPDDPWFPVVNTGQVRLSHDNGENLYRVVEYNDQIFSHQSGAGFFDVVDEIPNLQSPRQVKLRHGKIVPTSVRFQVGENIQTDSIIDYDVEAGVLYAGRKLTDAGISVDYIYESLEYTYDYINLNPIATHNPDARCNFIVLYMIPNKIERIGLPPETYTQTIFHTIEPRLEDAIDQVAIDAIEPITSQTLYPVILGIFQVSSDRDIEQVNVLDVRTRGGGVMGKAHPDQDESNYYLDIGHADGEPFAASGPAVVEVPQTVFDPLEAALENQPTVVDTRYNAPGGETQDTIKAISQRYLAAGVHPLVRTYK